MGCSFNLLEISFWRTRQDKARGSSREEVHEKKVDAISIVPCACIDYKDNIDYIYYIKTITNVPQRGVAELCEGQRLQCHSTVFIARNGVAVQPARHPNTR